MNSNIVNSLGLILDILGAVLIFIFGLPAKIDRDGHGFLIIESDNQEEKAKAKKYDCYSALGLCLLIVGFVLQLISNFL